MPGMGTMGSAGVGFGALRVVFWRGTIDIGVSGSEFCCSCRIPSEDFGVKDEVFAPGRGAAYAVGRTLLNSSRYSKHAHLGYMPLRPVPWSNGDEVSISSFCYYPQLLDLRLSDPHE